MGKMNNAQNEHNKHDCRGPKEERMKLDNDNCEQSVRDAVHNKKPTKAVGNPKT
jgi:hypothetical protein